MSYEEKIKSLEEVISKLEHRETALDDGIKLYEKGIKITSECMQELKHAKGKITILQNELGKLLETDFNLSEVAFDEDDL